MSSNSLPEDDRNFFVRLADNWYGSADNSVNGWNPDMPSQFAGMPFGGSADEGIGYYRFSTGPGNETRDAIFTVLANNLGLDNAMRASLAREEGDWSTWAKEIAGGVTELALLGKSTVGAVGYKAVARGLPAVANAFRRAPVTTRGLPSLAPITSASGGQVALRIPLQRFPQFPGFVTDTVTPLARLVPGATTTARTGPRPITQLRPGNVVDAIGNVATRFGNAGWSGVARRLAPSRLPGGRFGAALGLVGIGSALFAGRRGSPAAATAQENAAATEVETPSTTPFRVVPRSGAGTTATPEDAANKARVDIAAINQQYNNILRELRGMYQLSETDEERERLRFMLADIEAQRDAGLQAISEGYARTVGQIQEQATLAGERTAERSQRYGADLEASADRAAQRMMLQNLQQQQQFRGLGSGSQTPVNEWIGLMSAMAPAQQLYTQRMGDISREGMEWLAQTVGAQGQAQSADLQRLAAATRSGAIARQQAEVSDRINRERELQRAAILDTMQRQAGAIQSANQFNASPAGGVSQIDRANTISTLVAQGYTPEEARQYFEASGLGAWDPSEEALARAAEGVRIRTP